MPSMMHDPEDGSTEAATSSRKGPVFLHPKRHGPPYSWKEIQSDLDAKAHRRRYGRDSGGRSFDGPAQICTGCGKACQRIYWSSPRKTWEHLCGRSGWLDICTDCKAWYPLDVDIIS